MIVNMFFRTYNSENNTAYDELVNIDGKANENFVEISGLLESKEQVMDELYNLPSPHQRCAAHTLNLIATVDVQEAEKDSSYKVFIRRVFGKWQGILISKINRQLLLISL